MSKKKLTFERIEPFIPYLGFVFVCILFGILTKGKLFGIRNLTMLVNQTFPLLIICCGATFYWAHGALDLSVGGVLGVACITSAYGFILGSPVLAFLFPILTAVLFGLLNGVVSAVLHLPSFLTSLCIMFIASGLLSYLATTRVIKVTTDTAVFDSFHLKLLVAGLVILGTYILFNFTELGKANKLIGGNPLASRYSGIRNTRQMIRAFLVAAICIGIAAFFTTARVKSIGASTGSGMQFNVIISMVFGGMSFGGGKNARISNGVMGAVTYSILSNGLQLAEVGTELVQLVKAVVFIVVIFLGSRNALERGSKALV